MDIHNVILFFHLVGVALGVGGASISDVTFLRALKDKKVSAYEYDSLRVLSRVVWAGIIILLLSGHSFLLEQYIERDAIPLLKSGRFLAKYLLVWVVFINGLAFHFKVFPLLGRLLNKDLSRLKASKVWLLAVTGAISGTTWYSIVALSILPRSWTYPYWYYLIGYGLLLSGGVLIARLLIGKILRNKR